MYRKASLVLLFSAFLLVVAGCSEEKITAPDPGSESAVTGDLDQAALTAQQESSSDPDKCFADIAVTAFSAPATVSPGGVLPLSATVTNLGSRDVRSDFTVRGPNHTSRSVPVSAFQMALPAYSTPCCTGG